MKILKWFMLTIGMFIVFVTIIFTVLKYMYPQQKPNEVSEQEKVKQFEEKVVGLEGYENRNQLIDSLQIAVDSLQNLLVAKNNHIDSLGLELKASLEKIDQQNTALSKYADLQQSAEIRNEKAKKIAKTFETMKSTEMAGILKNIDDSTVLAIYKNMNNRFKKNLLMALTTKRAADLTEKFIELPGE